jgi:dethiobiotin synthetase
MQRTIVITGTDTGVGKTILTALLVCHLRASGRSVAALKPICSGGRADARMLRRALDNELKLEEINPWHFRAPVAPLLAARKENRRVELREVISHIHAIAHRYEIALVEGAGGLLSPLGEGVSTREVIGALGAEVIVVARNRLGVINHVRLTFEALPPVIAARAKLVLMSPPRADESTRSNLELLGDFMPPERMVLLPRFRKAGDFDHMLKQSAVQRGLDVLLH